METTNAAATNTRPQYRVHWFESFKIRDEGTDHESAGYTMNCCIQQYFPEEEDWMDAENPTVADAFAHLRDGDDWEDSLPYAEARERLLSRAGLTESDITDEDDGCW